MSKETSLIETLLCIHNTVKNLVLVGFGHIELVSGD